MDFPGGQTYDPLRGEGFLLFRSFQKLPYLGLAPLKCFLSWHGAAPLKGLCQPRLVLCFQNNKETEKQEHMKPGIPTYARKFQITSLAFPEPDKMLQRMSVKLNFSTHVTERFTSGFFYRFQKTQGQKTSRLKKPHGRFLAKNSMYQIYLRL